MTSLFEALGIIAPSGTRYFRIVTEFGGPVLPASDFHIANSRLPADLARYGITLSNKKDLEALLQSVSAVTDFQPADVAEHPGWNGSWFAQQSGVPIGADLGPSHVAFSPSPTAVPASGTLQGWIDGVARPASRHPIAAFAIMTAFLAPVLRFIPKVGNPTFELVGGADTGKSTVQKLAASVAFSPEGLVSLTQVQRDLEAVRQAGRDHPVIIDHVAAPLLTANKPKKAEIYAAVAHNLPRAPGGRVTLISGRCALRDACAIGSVDDSIRSAERTKEAMYFSRRSLIASQLAGPLAISAHRAVMKAGKACP